MLCKFCRLNEATSELPNSRGGLDPVCDNCRAALEEQAYDDYMADLEEEASQQDFARLLTGREDARLIDIAPELLATLELEEDAYMMSIANANEDLSTCMSADMATDQLYFRARQQRRATIEKATGQ